MVIDQAKLARHDEQKDKIARIQNKTDANTQPNDNENWFIYKIVINKKKEHWKREKELRMKNENDRAVEIDLIHGRQTHEHEHKMTHPNNTKQCDADRSKATKLQTIGKPR